MIDILTPLEQEGTKATVRNWLKKIGDQVAENDPLVELETDKVTLEVPAPAAGVLCEIILSADAEAEPGALLGRLRETDALNSAEPSSGEGETAPAIAVAPSSPQPENLPERRLSPSVRRAVRQHGLDPAGIKGSGRSGRITRADIDAIVSAQASSPPAATPVAGARSVPHDRMRKAIAQSMLNSVTVAPHVTAIFEADFSAIIAHRGRHKAAFAQDGVNLTFTAYFLMASVAAMRAVPIINSRWHEDRLEFFDDFNIGVGTALGEKGLIVPVIHRAQELSLFGIALRLQDLIGRARANKLVPADVRGGTFTISNHGVSGSLLASPIIINQPQSAILGIGKLEKRVVVREIDGADAIQIRPLSYVSLTIDHRVVDGHQTNAWLSSFVRALEEWPLDG
jgi:2-oxoglutarate dehydrogenase E2 component (dihydrolipoamide succinyltransferase)